MLRIGISLFLYLLNYFQGKECPISKNKVCKYINVKKQDHFRSSGLLPKTCKFMATSVVMTKKGCKFLCLIIKWTPLSLSYLAFNYGIDAGEGGNPAVNWSLLMERAGVDVLHLDIFLISASTKEME